MLTICQNLTHFNPFQANASFSYSLKTLGSLCTVCRGVNTPPPHFQKNPPLLGNPHFQEFQSTVKAKFSSDKISEFSNFIAGSNLAHMAQL